MTPALLLHDTQRREAVMAYCKRVRNPHKQAYALAYGCWVEFARFDSDEPKRPPELSFMGGQAVRLQIDAIRARFGSS